MSPEFDEGAVDATEAVETLRSLQDESLAPHVNQFAHFLAGRLCTETLLPSGFVMASALSIYDLQTGIDGFSGESIKNSLVGSSNTEYDKLQTCLPDLARAAFSKNFADAVLNHMVEINAIPAPEAIETPTLDEGEIITEAIDNIDDAYTKIVEDARQRVAELDWLRFGIPDTNIAADFDNTYLLTLRNAPYSLSLNLLIDNPQYEAGLLQELLPNQKKNIKGQYWLGLMSDIILPEAAMITRDHIFLKGIETVAVIHEADALEAVRFHARDVDGPVRRAAIRLHTLLDENPEQLR
jgi:hypothetical protein